jgi:hypothetical protein
MIAPVTVITKPMYVGQRSASLYAIHKEVMNNFAYNMDCSIEDIDRVIYKLTYYNLSIYYIRIVLVDGTDYIFSCEYPDADGRLEDIAYTTSISYREWKIAYENDDSDEINDPFSGILIRYSYRVSFEKVERLPKSIIKQIGSTELEDDITISLPSKTKSFTVHHKELIRIDRRRRKGEQEIYKEWDETVNYYPITIIDYPPIEKPLNCPDNESSINYSNIGWTDDD